MELETGSLVTPGDRIAVAVRADGGGLGRECAGPGTYIAQAGDELLLRASIAGWVDAGKSVGDPVTVRTGAPGSSSVANGSANGGTSSNDLSSALGATVVVPAVGDEVLVRVTRVGRAFANVQIVAVKGTPLKEPYDGMIKSQDVRSEDIDNVELYKAFRPGDIVRATVLSLGDARSYYLSTARKSLGVLFATSGAGALMTPVSWEQMQCPQTGVKEWRKVAAVSDDVV